MIAGDWRLPNVKETQSLFDYGKTNPWLASGHPFIGVEAGESDGQYWTSTTYYAYPWAAWFVDLCHGHVGGSGYKDTSHHAISYHYVWPVRDAQ